MLRVVSWWMMVLVALAWAMPADVAAKGRPNVVLIMADDLGYGDPGVYNAQSKIPTPRIDRLAAQGMRFTDAHTPERRLYAHAVRVAHRTLLLANGVKRGVLQGYSPALIEPERLTLASLLKKQGYRTACIGKWHLGLGTQDPADYAQPLSPGPNAVGFDESFVLPASLDFPPYVFVENERATTFPSEEIAESKQRRQGGGGYWRAGAIAPGFRHEDTLPTLADRAVAFLDRQSGDEPFFLYFPLTAPHTPWMPTKEFRGRTAAGYYGDFVAQVDATVGRVLDVLDERKLADDTLVIFTSDNGAHWLPSDIDRFGHRANAAWRGQKADIWEGGHRVPFLVRWPGVVKPAATSDQLVCLTDCMATIAEITGRQLAPGEGEDSFSFKSVLTGESPERPLRSTVVHQSGDGTLAVRDGSWKLVAALGSHGFSTPKNVEPQPGGPTGQLYNLADDPAESHNRWLDQPEAVERLTALLTAYEQQGYTRPGGR